MGYYQMGDYYMGDYYRGDPGLLGSIFGGIKSVARIGLRVASRVLPGPFNIPAKIAQRTLFPGAGRPAPPGRAVRQQLYQRGLPQVTGGFQKGVSAQIKIDPQTGQMVARRRRINPANPKALRRALRRVSGFAKLAQRAKRDIARANAAVGNRSTSRRGATVTVNPTAAQVRAR